MALTLFVLVVVLVLVQAGAPGAALQLVAILAVFMGTVWVAVQVTRANRLARSLRVSHETFPELQAILDDVRRTLDYNKRIEVFVADKCAAPVTTTNYLGTRIMVLEGGLVGGLLADRKADQLTFLIGREIGALKARLTRLDVLVILLNFVNALKLMAPFLLPYYRATTYSGDQLGMACAGSLEAALEATRRLLVGDKLAPTLRPGVVVPQAALVRRRLLPRFAQLFAAEPHTTNRYGNLLCFGRYYDPDGWNRVATTMSPQEAAAFEEVWRRSAYSGRAPAVVSPTPDAQHGPASEPLATTPTIDGTDDVVETPGRENPAAAVQHRSAPIVPPYAQAPRGSTRAVVIAVVVTAVVAAGIAGAVLINRSDDAGSASGVVDQSGVSGTTSDVPATTESVGLEPFVEADDLPVLIPTTVELGGSFAHLALDSEDWYSNSSLGSASTERAQLIADSGRVDGYNAEFSLAEDAEFSDPTPVSLSVDLFESVDGASYFLTRETEFELNESESDERYTLLDSSLWYPSAVGDESTGFVQTYNYAASDGSELTLYYLVLGFRRDVVVGWASGWFGEATSSTEQREQLTTEAAEALLIKIDDFLG